MAGTIVSRCRSCQAVVNVNWQSCVACQQPIKKGIESGCLIWWQSMDGVTRGPAVVRGNLNDHGQTWVWFTFGGIEYLVNERLITKMEEGGDGV